MRTLPGPDRDAAQVILRHAIDRGELAPDIDMQIALDIITGLLWRRMILADQTLVLRALGVEPAT